MSDPILSVEVTNFPAAPSPIPEAQKLLDFKDSGEVAPGTSSTHSKSETSPYSLRLEKIMVSSLGLARWEIMMGNPGSEVTRAVLITGPTNHNAEFDLAAAFDGFIVNSGQNVLVVGNNIDSRAQSLYSTIIGLEA